MTTDAGGLRVEPVTGAAVGQYLAALAVLRIEVFREYPYLYDGDVAYEEKYLATYARSPDALVAIAWDGDLLIGAATALPLTAHSDEVVPPLQAAGYDPATVYYFGESVLRPPTAAAGWATGSSTSARASPGPAATAPPRSARWRAPTITRGDRRTTCPTTGSGPGAASSSGPTSSATSRGRISTSRPRPPSRWCSGSRT